MERPSLTLMLASVVSARLDGDPRRLLSHLHPPTPAPAPAPAPALLASVSTLPRVIPMQRRHTETVDRAPELDPRFDPDFDPAAA